MPFAYHLFFASGTISEPPSRAPITKKRPWAQIIHDFPTPVAAGLPGRFLRQGWEDWVATTVVQATWLTSLDKGPSHPPPHCYCSTWRISLHLPLNSFVFCSAVSKLHFNVKIEIKKYLVRYNWHTKNSLI